MVASCRTLATRRMRIVTTSSTTLSLAENSHIETAR
jgi:hypothetical protein